MACVSSEGANSSASGEGGRESPDFGDGETEAQGGEESGQGHLVGLRVGTCDPGVPSLLGLSLLFHVTFSLQIPPPNKGRFKGEALPGDLEGPAADKYGTGMVGEEADREQHLSLPTPPAHNPSIKVLQYGTLTP